MACNNKVSEWSAAVQTAMAEGAFGDYCRAATVKGVTGSVSASATGATNATPITEGGTGDCLRFEGYGSDKYKLVALIFSDATADATVGVGEIKYRGKAIEPELQGSFADGKTSSEFLTLAAMEAGLNAIPVDCLPAWSADDPLDVCLYDTSAAPNPIQVLAVYVPAG